ncbi:MAG: fimbrillin family protein [Prevotella sp.]|nr:fimbrillin family protein [Prevotella sp.]
MKQNKLFLGLATMFAVAFTFTACSSDDAETQSVQQDRTIRLTSSVERGSTRATSDPQSGTSLSTSSNLAIWAINQSGSAALTNGNNEQYTVNGSGNLTPKTSDNTMTWPDGATLDFYAYAPYSSTYSYNEANDFSVATDQSTEADYLASDLVLAQATGKTYNANTPVALPFKHLLSKLSVTINKEDGSNFDLTNASVTITNTKIATTFKPSATDGNEDKILGTATNVSSITAVSALGEATTACAVLVPQTISAGTELIKIVSGNKTLIAKLGTNTTLESGKSYSFTVNVGTVNDDTPAVVTVALGVASVTEWDSTDNTLGAVSFPKWYAKFETPGSNATYSAPTYTWTGSTSNLMQIFSFTKGELVNYKKLVFTTSSLSSGGSYRINISYGSGSNENMNITGDHYNDGSSSFGSAGTKTITMSHVSTALASVSKTLSDVKAIRFGGSSSNGGSINIQASDCYLDTEE